MKNLLRIAFVCATATLAGCGDMPKLTTIRSSDDYVSTVKKTTQTVVLPAVATVNMVDIAGGQERMYDYEATMEALITRELGKALRAKGYAVTVIDKRAAHDRHLARLISDARADYTKQRNALYAKDPEDEKIALHTNKTVAAIAPLTQAGNFNGNVLVFADYVQRVKTDGARTRDFLMDGLFGTSNGANVDNAMLYVGLINADTGQWLWSNTAFDFNTLLGDLFSGKNEAADQERISALLKQILLPLPEKLSATLSEPLKDDSHNLLAPPAAAR